MNRETTDPYDSEFCGNLPIHLINLIQDYGILVIVSRITNKVIQVSENASLFFDLPVDKIIGADISSFVKEPLMDGEGQDLLPKPFTIQGKMYSCLVHHYEHYTIMEINNTAVADAESFEQVYRQSRNVITEIEAAGSVNEILNLAAAVLKKVSGFDKVMIYRFDENWNGHVLAEIKEPDMESYLGVTFPASDIPRQARELYQKNPYRFIPDRTYKPSRMFPVINELTGRFIDLSDCNLRGVSSVHLDYLKNMGVIASMSTRIMKEGKLWGLIACHHKTRMAMNFNTCSLFELFSDIISTRITALQDKENHSADHHLSETYALIVEETYRSGQLSDTLLQFRHNVRRLFHAQGAALVLKGNILSAGAVPSNTDIEELVLWLSAKEYKGIFFSNNLSAEYEFFSDHRTVASGLLSIPINPEQEDFLLIFRSEIMQVVNWGGDPTQRIVFEKDMKTYHPRHSFKVWQQLVEGFSADWTTAEVSMAGHLQAFVRSFLNGQHYSYNS